MNNVQILYPILAMVALTFIVAGVMLRRRVKAMKQKRIHPQKTAMSAQMAALIEDTRASDNFRNLFETPVLFYAAIVTIYATKLPVGTYVTLAWIYVAARYAHSYLQCGPNVVMRRFYAFLTSMVTLLIMWIVLALDLFTAKL